MKIVELVKRLLDFNYIFNTRIYFVYKIQCGMVGHLSFQCRNHLHKGKVIESSDVILFNSSFYFL